MDPLLIVKRTTQNHLADAALMRRQCSGGAASGEPWFFTVDSLRVLATTRLCVWGGASFSNYALKQLLQYLCHGKAKAFGSLTAVLQLKSLAPCKLVHSPCIQLGRSGSPAMPLEPFGCSPAICLQMLEMTTFLATQQQGGAAWKQGAFQDAPPWVKWLMKDFCEL